MNDWLHELPLLWMAVAVFGVTYLATAAIYATLTRLGKRVRAFKIVSPSILSPIGVLFALFVAFTAQQVLDDNDRAAAAVNREAAALSAFKFLAASFPGPSEAQMENLIRQYIEEAATREWPAMARQKAAVNPTPLPLAQALELTLSLTPGNPGQEIAQREIATSLENVLDARRAAHYRQHFASKSAQVVLSGRAGTLHHAHHRHRSQRESARRRDRDGNLCRRSSSVVAAGLVA
jgi:hypothetical protein